MAKPHLHNFHYIAYSKVLKLKKFNKLEIKMPTFTVVIPLFNKEPYIKRSIESVLAQNFQDFEIIVVDDGSTDNGAYIVNNVKDQRIRLIRQENMGVSVARNKGIKEAKSDLISFLDADDEWLPTFLETVFRLSVKYPEAGIYSTTYYFSDSRGKIRIPKYKKIQPFPWEGLMKSYFLSTALGENPICSSAVCIPKNILIMENGFKVGSSWGEDDDLWGRIALKYPVAFSWQFGAVYHTEATNRLCNRKQILEHPFIETAEKAIINGDVKNSEMKEYLNECIARHKIIDAVHNLYRGYPTVSRNILKNCNTKMLYKEKIFWQFISIVPFNLFIKFMLFSSSLKSSLVQILQTSPLKSRSKKMGFRCKKS